jgi:hypothetical protein
VYGIIILLVILCGYKTWPLTYTEVCRLKVFVNRALRKIFRHKRDDVTGDWRRLHNEELYDLYLPNIPVNK